MIAAEETFKALSQSSKNVIFDIMYGHFNSLILRAAHELNLFEILKKGMTKEAIIKELNASPRGIQTVLSMCTSLGLIELQSNGKYILTDLSRAYLVKDSPYYMGPVLKMQNVIYEASLESFMKAIIEGKPQIGDKGQDVFENNQKNLERIKFFTHFMNSKSAPYSDVWPLLLDLSQYKCLLDIGGGSGIHALNAVKRFMNLQAVVFELEPVCHVANEYIKSHNLESKVRTQAGNMWEDPFPAADIHFYSDVFHDWPIEKCQFLLEKSYNCLKNNDRIIILEMLFDDEKTGPLQTSVLNSIMLYCTQGQQFSREELTQLLKKVGFVDIKIIPIGFRELSVITAQKKA